MTLTKNSDYGYEELGYVHQFELIQNKENILNLGSSQISKLLRKNNYSFDEIDSENTSDFLDRLIIGDSWKEKFPYVGKQYDVIILDDILEHVKYPAKILKQLTSLLTKDGYFIGKINNFSYVVNIAKILEGSFYSKHSFRKLHNYTLDPLLLLLGRNELSINKLIRIEKNFELDTQREIKQFSFPFELYDTLIKDPESNVIQYVFSVQLKQTVPFTTRQWLSEFPKNIITEKIKNKFEHMNYLIFQQEYTINTDSEKSKHIQQSINEKIHYFEKSIKEKTTYYENAIKEKNKVISGLEDSVNKQKDMISGLEDSISIRDDIISKMENTPYFKILRKFDKLRKK